MLILGLVLGLWVVGAAWAILRGLSIARRAEHVDRLATRMTRMLDEAPVLPLLVRSDGRIEAPDRLAGWFGLEKMPEFLSELSAEGQGIPGEEYEALFAAVRNAQKGGEPFHMALSPQGGDRSLVARGHLADPQISPGSAALIWLFDMTEVNATLRQLGEERDTARNAFAALSGLIEAAPMPMWHRGPDLKLMLVNQAYVTAVDGTSAEDVIAAGTELVEPQAGMTAMAIAAKARKDDAPVSRMVPATINGQRQMLHVTDLPLGETGVAGYAVNVQELEDRSRQLEQFRAAQRDLLDHLSAAVAQFDRNRALIFSNQPFLRLFDLKPVWLTDQPEFDRVLDRMRETGRLPEVRDFPAWRSERHGWFLAPDAAEENWQLPDGTHLRVIAQPTPDGGLLLLFEDRTEQVQLASARDTLLRARTATFDNLFESLAVFSPDGRLNIWNRRFGTVWGLDEEFLATHPRVDQLLGKMGNMLKRPAQIGAISEVIRAATLDRQETGGKIALADGRHFEFAGVPLPDGNALFTTLDITDSHAVEQALRDRNEALIEADSLKTRFLANMSYEFRTPLTSISGFAEMLASGLAGPLTPQGEEYVKAILDSVERLTGQIENVLDLTQSEAGNLPLVKAPVSVFNMVKALVTERQGALDKAGLSLDLRGSSIVGTIEGDERRLAQALGQVIDNAIAFTPHGGQIQVQVDRHQGGVRVLVADNGPGMDAETLAQINRSRDVSGVVPGTPQRKGLGIALARQLIEAHKGSFELASEAGQGTVVAIWLP